MWLLSNAPPRSNKDPCEEDEPKPTPTSTTVLNGGIGFFDHLCPEHLTDACYNDAAEWIRLHETEANGVTLNQVAEVLCLRTRLAALDSQEKTDHPHPYWTNAETNRTTMTLVSKLPLLATAFCKAMGESSVDTLRAYGNHSVMAWSASCLIPTSSDPPQLWNYETVTDAVRDRMSVHFLMCRDAYGRWSTCSFRLQAALCLQATSLKQLPNRDPTMFKQRKILLPCEKCCGGILGTSATNNPARRCAPPEVPEPLHQDSTKPESRTYFPISSTFSLEVPETGRPPSDTTSTRYNFLEARQKTPEMLAARDILVIFIDRLAILPGVANFAVQEYVSGLNQENALIRQLVNVVASRPEWDAECHV